jgi:hypothetical protein
MGKKKNTHTHTHIYKLINEDQNFKKKIHCQLGLNGKIKNNKTFIKELRKKNKKS